MAFKANRKFKRQYKNVTDVKRSGERGIDSYESWVYQAVP
jgi:hypothetical protein